MQYPFLALQAETTRLLSTAKITRPQVVSRGVDEIMRVISSYEDTAKATGIPAAWIACADCREDDCNPRDGIGQGDPWNRVSRHVPAGNGPFASKSEADRFYLHYDRIDQLQGSTSWTLPYMTFDWEKWNGFGPRAHGYLSGYPWSCTDVYDTPKYGGHGKGGKYVADGVWDPGKLDPQPGCVALYLELIRRRPDLAVGSLPAPIGAPPIAAPASPPEGVHDAETLQADLNRLPAAAFAPDYQFERPLLVDGSYGRMTRRAVMAFQEAAGLAVDGVAGPLTRAEIAKKLAA